MYSPFSQLSRINFVKQQLAEEYLSFPQEISKAYENTCKWLFQFIPNFDDNGLPSNLNRENDSQLDKQNTGREFTCWLPGHAMKVYQSLLHVEDELTGSILDKPNITIIDVGCGGGTASVALISLIARYQKFKQINNLPIFPVTINCLGIDPKEDALQIYGQFLNACKERVAQLLLNIKVSGHRGTLPESSGWIIDGITQQKHVHSVVIALANVIRPLAEELKEQSTSRARFDRTGLAALLPPGWGKEIAFSETNVVSALLNIRTVDQITMLLLSARGGTGYSSKKRWNKEMESFQRSLRLKLSALQHEVKDGPIQTRHFRMVNPPHSYHHKYSRYERSPVYLSYESGSVVINNESLLGDTDWRAILDHENLLLAWARVRNGIGFERLEDTIELRLFEANIEERLRLLSSRVRSYQWRELNVAEMLEFPVPKGPEEKPRPVSLCRLEDQILATAILQVRQPEYEEANGRRSFGYKLTRRKGEHLYEHWLPQYRDEYLQQARKVAEQNRSWKVIQTDLSSYYTTVDQSLLFNAAEHHLQLYHSRSSDLTSELIRRNFKTGTPGIGIPQSHIVSGAWANLYLAKVDRKFESGNELQIEYFRFVDDMIFIFPPSLETSLVLKLLDKELERLGLKRSTKKTEIMSADEFLARTAPDPELEVLSLEHNRLLSELYRLDRNYIRVALDDWWGFVERYQSLLASILVFISVPRLSRKLQKNLTWWRRFTAWLYRPVLPEVKHLSELEDVNKWQSEFVGPGGYESPRRWIIRRAKLVEKLSALLNDSLPLLASESKAERTRAATRVKFALYRLGQLGFGDDAETVAKLLVEQPWTLDIRQVCHALALQGQEDLLLKVFNQIADSDEGVWGYVRGIILKSLSHLPSVSVDSTSLLRDAAFNSNTVLERTMASEALLLLQETSTLQKEQLARAVCEAEDDYLSKNYAILYAIARGEGEPLRADLEQGRILNEAIEYTRIVPDVADLYRNEPEILRKEFYEGDYPDNAEEFENAPY